jgi:exodeoxyribonuclease V alpha subunit
MEYTVNITQEIPLGLNDFHIYLGVIEGEMFETSFKVAGFSLSSDCGKKILVGDEGTYNGKRTVNVKYEKTDYSDIEVQKNILMGIKGVGPEKIDNILNSFDNNIFKVLDFDFRSKLKIKGFGKKTLPRFLGDLDSVVNSLNQNTLFNELQVLLHNKLKPAKIRELSNCVNDIEDLHSKPYELLVDSIELGFKKADDIALNTLKIDKDNEERISYLLAYILGKSINGNTYMELNDFVDEVVRNNIDNPLDKIMKSEQIVVDGDSCYPKKIYHAEVQIPRILKGFIDKESIILNREIIEEYIFEAESLFGIKYDESQINAIIETVNLNVNCLVGNAGSGKSTTLKAVIFVLRKLRYHVRCLAPTGKAGRRLEEATGNPASTIHSYIASHEHGKNNLCDDVLIVDEFSMCDIVLLYNLISICKNLDYKKIIFVGDDGQLASVQPGNNLFDFIQSGVINITRLNKIHRQGSDSNIIDYAYKIRNNTPVTAIKERDLYFQNCNSVEDFYIQIDKMWIHLRSKYDCYSSFLDNVQFISPLKKGDTGCEAINKYIQAKYNDNDMHKFLGFKIGDKVMNIKNNKDKNIFNGECGSITDIGRETFTVNFPALKRQIEFKFDEKINFILAYCCTIHKLQGSEYKFIVMIIGSDSIFLDSKILYTGATRGKETVIILSKIDIFNRIVKRNNTTKRTTGLQDRLKSALLVEKMNAI